MTTRPSLWSARADELLADGEWHDGLSIAKEAEKAIPPGVAARRAERNRALSSQARNGQPKDRVIERPLARLIAFGRRSIIQALFNARFREGVWVTDVPIPDDGWQQGGWRVRDIRVTRDTILGIARRHHVSKEIVRKLVFQDPPLEHTTTGTWTYVTDLPGFARRLDKYRAGNPERRSRASRATHERKRSEPRDVYSLTELADMSRMSTENARVVCDSNPGLPWTHKGRASFLPKGELAGWEKAVQVWRDGTAERRSKAAKEVRARGRQRGVP